MGGHFKRFSIISVKLMAKAVCSQQQQKSENSRAIEHSKNKIHHAFRKQLWTWSVSVQCSTNTKSAKFYTRTESTHNQLHVLCNFGILAAFGFVECRTEALQV